MSQHDRYEWWSLNHTLGNYAFYAERRSAIDSREAEAAKARSYELLTPYARFLAVKAAAAELRNVKEAGNA